MIAISQRQHSQHYPHLKSDWPKSVSHYKTPGMIIPVVDLLWFIAGCQGRSSSSSNVVDLYLDQKDHVWIPDFNPWATSTDPLLFDWSELMVTDVDDTANDGNVDHSPHTGNADCGNGPEGTARCACVLLSSHWTLSIWHLWHEETARNLRSSWNYTGNSRNWGKVGPFQDRNENTGSRDSKPTTNAAHNLRFLANRPVQALSQNCAGIFYKHQITSYCSGETSDCCNRFRRVSVSSIWIQKGLY